MTTSTREAIMIALLALGATLQWGSPPSGFVYTSRRVKTADQLEGLQPALMQSKFRETVDQAYGVSAKRIFDVEWFIYFYQGDDDAITEIETDQILDAVDALFEPLFGPVTLGGLVERVFVQGETMILGGNITGQVMIVVPLKIICP